MRGTRRQTESGLTFVEMIATAAILAILASAILPMARMTYQRSKELELRRALRELRTAIDEYHRCVPMTGTGAPGAVPVAVPSTVPGGAGIPQGGPVCRQPISPLENKMGMEGYPEKLESLVEGVQAQGMTDKKVKFLRRIPVDPMTNSTEWGLRCYQDDPDSTSWCGKNVYDVYSKSEASALDGTTKYSEW